MYILHFRMLFYLALLKCHILCAIDTDCSTVHNICRPALCMPHWCAFISHRCALKFSFIYHRNARRCIISARILEKGKKKHRGGCERRSLFQITSSKYLNKTFKIITRYDMAIRRTTIGKITAVIVSVGARLDHLDRFNASGRSGSAFCGGSAIAVEAVAAGAHLHINENSPAR